MYHQPMSDADSGSSVAAAASSGDGPVHRAFALLQLVVSAGEAVGVRELGRRSGLSRSTTSRTLGILADLGMVERTTDGGARPGTALATLTRRVEQSPAVLRDRFRPLAAEMRRVYGENAAVGIDDGNGFLYLASARVPAAVQVADPTGQSYAYHLIAPGLVVMAHWPPDRLAAYLAAPLERATANSVVRAAVIRRRLAAIRTTGYAWTDQELDLEVNGLAAPILGSGGGLLAVATLYGPAYRFAQALQPELGAEFAAFIADRAAPLVG
jgi:IclR family acetate operon transcriptional repressor